MINLKIPVYLFLLLAVHILYAQSDILQNIISLKSDGATKQQKIDSLILEFQKSSSSPNIADFYHDLGSKWFYIKWKSQKTENKNLELAIKYTKLAIHKKKELDYVDIKSLKKSLFNLGVFQNSYGKTFAAIDSYIELIRLDYPDKKTQQAHRNVAEGYGAIGDYKKAIEHYYHCLEFYKKSDEYDNKVVEIYIDLADLYASMGYVDYSEEILKNLKKADSLLQKISIQDIFSEARISQISSNLWIELGNNRKALKAQKKLLSSQKHLSKENLARIYNSTGVSYLRLNKPEESIRFLEKSMNLDNGYSSPFENLGDLHLEKKEFQMALNYYQNAIRMLGQNTLDDIIELPKFENIELVVDKISLLSHLIAKAKGWLSYYENNNSKKYLEYALDTFTLADKLVELIRSESSEFQSRLYWREKSSSLYMKAVAACQLLDRPREAYYFMERNKALLLLQDLTNEDAKQIAELPKEKAEREFNLKRAILLSENKLQEQLASLKKDSLNQLKKSIRSHKYDYKEFIDSLEKTYPDYAKLKKRVDVLSFEDLKANYITENKATLHYILNEEDGYGLLTTTDATVLFRLDNIAILNKNIEQLIADLSNGVSGINGFQKISNTVFKQLFPKDVYEKIKEKQLTIIPDYTLQRIPFESLVVDNTALKYFFQDVETGYAYSASLLDHTKKVRAATKMDFLGVAPIEFDGLKLPELYFSENEVRSIASVFSGETLLSGNASKTNFTKNANDSNIIHLATHADIGDSENPWIAFNDSKMYLKEIYATKNQADMVVLSACNTSSGELKRGEGVMSLARGFFYSGAKSVVSTLWPVSDETGKDILVDFYKNLKEGLTKSKALQKAKLDYLKNTEEEELKHPYYWAGFVVLGDNSPISDKPISTWLLAGIGILGAGILVFGYRKIKAHRAAA